MVGKAWMLKGVKALLRLLIKCWIIIKSKKKKCPCNWLRGTKKWQKYIKLDNILHLNLVVMEFFCGQMGFWDRIE
jgi:hypothetical protein